MLSLFIPDIYQKSIYEINYQKLKKNGLKCLIFDLNNTLVPLNAKSPNKKVKDLMEDLKILGFKLIIISNSTKKRVEPFKDILCIDSAYLSFKPFKRKYKKILKVYNFKETEVACIGDRLMFDVLGANRMDFTSVLVNPIGISDYIYFKADRLIENSIYNYLEKKDILKKGVYYD